MHRLLKNTATRLKYESAITYSFVTRGVSARPYAASHNMVESAKWECWKREEAVAKDGTDYSQEIFPN